MLTFDEAVAKLDSLLDAGITVTMLCSEEGTSVKTDFSPTAIRAAVCNAMLAVNARHEHEYVYRDGDPDSRHEVNCDRCITEATILAAFQQDTKEEEAMAKLEIALGNPFDTSPCEGVTYMTLLPNNRANAIRAAVCNAMLAVHFRTVREMHGLESESTEAVILAAFQRDTGG